MGKFVKRNVFTNLLNYIGSEIVDDYIADVEYTLMTVSIYINNIWMTLIKYFNY